MISPRSELELDQLLTQPNAADIAFAQRLQGDTIVLGAAERWGLRWPSGSSGR